MALTAFWLRFAPRQFARGRDYEVSSGEPSLSPQQSTAFAILAEGALRAAKPSIDTVWQFAALSADGPAVLARCETEERDGARARVIWALALPLEYVRSSSFALHTYVDRFAALPASAGSLPAPIELTQARAAPAGIEVTKLLAKYIEAGTVRVALDATQALKLFCQTLELLPPGDRLRVTFSTAPADARTFEADPAAPAPEALSVGEEARAIANLWSIFRYGVAQPVQGELSLTRNPVEWICSLLATEDVPVKFRGLSKLILEHLDAPQQPTAFALLRRALELQLMRSEPQRAAATLAQLEADGYLGSDYGTPPIWIARLAVELDLMPHLPATLLQKILRPGSLAFLLNSLERTASVRRLQCWLAGLQRAGVADATARRELLQACRDGWRGLLGPQARVFGHGDLARSVALLSLYEQCRGEPQRVSPPRKAAPRRSASSSRSASSKRAGPSR